MPSFQKKYPVNKNINYSRDSINVYTHTDTNTIHLDPPNKVVLLYISLYVYMIAIYMLNKR